MGTLGSQGWAKELESDGSSGTLAVEKNNQRDYSSRQTRRCTYGFELALAQGRLAARIKVAELVSHVSNVDAARRLTEKAIREQEGALLRLRPVADPLGSWRTAPA